MAILDFPSSPTNGQKYTLNGVSYYYDSTVGAWLTTVVQDPLITSVAHVGSSPPSLANTQAGDIWFNTDLLRMFVYYNDGTSSQWVEPAYSTAFPQYDLLNTAFTVANVGFGIANAGYSVANAGYTVSNSAYTTANAGYTVANAAFGAANGAATTTNAAAAFAKANTALANTTNTVFSGNLTITGTSTVGSSIVSGAVIETKVAMAANDVNLLAGSYFTKTIGSATTLTVSNVPATGNAASFILDLTNGGAGTITWWSGTKWAGGSAPTLTASGRDVLGFFTHDGGTTWSGLVLGKDVK